MLTFDNGSPYFWAKVVLTKFISGCCMAWDLICGTSWFYEKVTGGGKSAILPNCCCLLSITVLSTPRDYTHYLYSTTKVMLILNSILHDQVPALRQHRQRHQCNLLYHRQQSEVRPQQRKWLFSSQPQLGQLSFRWAKAQSYTYIYPSYVQGLHSRMYFCFFRARLHQLMTLTLHQQKNPLWCLVQQASTLMKQPHKCQNWTFKWPLSNQLISIWYQILRPNQVWTCQVRQHQQLLLLPLHRR